MSDSPLIWENNIPTSTIYDDIYFSTESGLLETNHVFIDGNNLRPRFASLNADFNIIETGFGTGLNFFSTWKLWREITPEHTLHYTSIEKHPLNISDIEKAISLWPEFGEYLGEFAKQYPAISQDEATLIFDNVHLNLKFADTNDALPLLRTKADAWFLDGFSPAKNPDMWNNNLYQNMSRLTVSRGTFATFTAVGNVRRGLQSNGFEVRKVAGFGQKRHILIGVKL